MKQYPFFLRATVILAFFSLLFLALYLGRGFFIPICLASIFSILLFPVVRFLEDKIKMHRIAANFLVLLVIFLILAGVVYILSTQILSFMDEIPKLQGQVSVKLQSIEDLIHHKTGMAPYKQIEWINSQLQSLISSSGTTVQGMVTSTANALATIGIICFYIFFFLFYRTKFKNFILRVSPEHSHEKIMHILIDSRAVIHSYISGVFIVVIIVAICIGSGLSFLGIPFAIFLGVLAGFFNIVPYVGIIISGLLGCTLTFLTKDSSWYVLGTAIVFLVTHLFEANILTPNIVGRKVSVNPLVVFMALLIGAEVWGIMGMILFIPMVGILKVFCDNIPALNPYGYLLGTEGTEEHAIIFRRRKHAPNERPHDKDIDGPPAL